MIRIVSRSMHAVRSAIAPHEQRERTLTPCGVKPMVGSAERTTAQMDAVILVLHMVTHLSLWRTAVRGVVPVAPWRQRYVTQ